ncbi:type VI secretion system PAAR protein [Vibrio fluvialis]|uniref:Uropathogenic-specific protein n=1 Tax=Vibrio fluvialis TaxID=676 RepID=A0A1W6EUF8_VIBFL|nr:type VI secretion system PAAR protein [Vibrio fluvialis]HDM8036223.1 type VI secretion system PAAR protein [Vibrio fluvialis clinical-1]ARK19362.1 uropathogenic-specific protein [Vibrio fluvialis]EKO3419888.1 type VI secretion system PAAR protein [Vibrio fluvialis]EKO3453689.1 type VI secretion system PAAR protein [Vibrio fluvialis]EKO3460507.1 type VI secretion system PAAR protein [Vibrio fluvialis]
MGNGIVVGHIGSAHDGFPPTPVTAGSDSVKIDGIPAARQGDPLAPHDKPKNPAHPRSIAAGSATVMIDGKPAARAGDAVDCGGVLQGGSSVNIG